MDDAVLPPLVLLHWLLAVELLVADVALERAVVAVGALVDLVKYRRIRLLTKLFNNDIKNIWLLKKEKLRCMVSVR